jgi:hypothetical protein
MSNKGVVRIIEVVIAGIILLTAMTYFVSPRLAPSDWQTANLQIEVQDSLIVLEKSGLLDKYIAERGEGGGYRLYYKLSVMLPKQTDFAINVTFDDGSSSDLCCDYNEQCCRNIAQTKTYTTVSYLSRLNSTSNYQISLKIWNVFY